MSIIDSEWLEKLRKVAEPYGIIVWVDEFGDAVLSINRTLLHVGPCCGGGLVVSISGVRVAMVTHDSDEDGICFVEGCDADIATAILELNIELLLSILSSQLGGWPLCDHLMASKSMRDYHVNFVKEIGYE